MGLREKQTAERRRRILDVADTLIRHTGGIDFSMRMLAEMAEVSPATPYNLFGSKEGILSASLARSLNRVILEGLAIESREPFDFIISANSTPVDLLVTRKSLFRPLYQYLLGVVDPIHRPAHIERSRKYWRTVAETGLSEVKNTREIRESDYQILAKLLFAHFLGLVELWVHEDIGDEMFRAQAVYGGLLIFVPFLSAEFMPQMQPRLDQARAVFDEAKARHEASKAKRKGA